MKNKEFGSMSSILKNKLYENWKYYWLSACRPNNSGIEIHQRDNLQYLLSEEFNMSEFNSVLEYPDDPRGKKLFNFSRN